MDGDGTVLDPAVTPYVPMPDPKPGPESEPCQLWLVTGGEFGYGPTEVELPGRSEAGRRAMPSISEWASLPKKRTGSSSPPWEAQRNSPAPSPQPRPEGLRGAAEGRMPHV